jgi:hypothetical protein
MTLFKGNKEAKRWTPEPPIGLGLVVEVPRQPFSIFDTRRRLVFSVTRRPLYPTLKIPLFPLSRWLSGPESSEVNGV